MGLMRTALALGSMVVSERGAQQVKLGAIDS